MEQETMSERMQTAPTLETHTYTHIDTPSMRSHLGFLVEYLTIPIGQLRAKDKKLC